MPRKRKTQPPVAMPGAQYGTGVDQVAQQEAIPLPDNTAAPQVAPPAPPRSATAEALAAHRGAVPQTVSPEAAVEMAQAMPFSPLDMGGPSAHPEIPLTAGAPIGPGVGPEAIPLINHTRNREVQVLEILAEVSGSPHLAAIAARHRGR